MSILSADKLLVRPVTQANWSNFERLFSQRGAPHYCWCGPYRFRGNQHLDKNERKSGMRRLVTDAVPIGVLAYHDDEPVGWCSVAPRESYEKLERSHTMPRVTDPGTATWTVLCFFVLRAMRGRGVVHALLSGAIEYARSEGARVIEGYPFDTAGITSTHLGHSSVFQKAGFHRGVGRRWSLELT